MLSLLADFEPLSLSGIALLFIVGSIVLAALGRLMPGLILLAVAVLLLVVR